MSKKHNIQHHIPHGSSPNAPKPLPVNITPQEQATQKSETELDKNIEVLSKNFNNLELVYYYGYILGQAQYEGSGIWNRFNIMIGLNVSLFGLMAFLYSTSIDNKYVLILIVSLSGLCFSVWSIAVLKRLWLYHYHWKDTLEELEKLLPDTLAKPFTQIPKTIRKRRRNAFKVWFKSYTQPFFLILVCIWISIIAFNIHALNKENKIAEEKANKNIKVEKANKIEQPTKMEQNNKIEPKVVK